MKSNLTDPEIQSAIEDHWRLQLGSYFSSVHDLDGATYNLGDKVVDYYWNYAGKIVTSKTGVEPLIERVLAFANSHKRKPAFYLDPSTKPSSFGGALRKRGFAPEDEEIWMFYPIKGKLVAPQPKASGLEIVPVNDAKKFKDFLKVFHAAYEMLGEGETHSVYGDSLIAAKKRPPMGVTISHFIGYVGGKPVSIASLYQSGKVAGLYNVGTPTEFRGKGYGALLSEAAIQAALSAKATKLMLQTGLDSPAQRLYERLGFILGFTAVIWSQK